VLNYLPHYEDMWGSGGIATHILNLSTRWSWVDSFMPWLFCPWYPLYRGLGGPQSQYGCSGKEKNSHL